MKGWTLQTYGYFPGESKVREKDSPLDKRPDVQLSSLAVTS